MIKDCILSLNVGYLREHLRELKNKEKEQLVISEGGVAVDFSSRVTIQTGFDNDGRTRPARKENFGCIKYHYFEDFNAIQG